MGRKYDFKYLVIGSGPAGSAAALALAKAKKRVGIIEGNRYGGANLNTRDIPYAVTLDFIHTYYKSLRLPEFNFQEFSFSFPSITAHQMKAVIESSSGNNPKAAEEAGLIYIQGYANFLDAHTVAVGDRQFTSENFILATGATLNAAGIAGLDTVNYLTPDNALQIRRLPKAALIVGGGSTGCEIAEYYATLGTKTLLFEQTARLLPTEDPEVGAAMRSHFIDDLGAAVYTSSQVVALAEDNISKYVIFKKDGEEKMVRVDTIILATGSTPVLNYGLENTGVKFAKTGALVVDKYFQTSVKHIFAIGDCAMGQPNLVPAPSTAKNGKNSKTALPPSNFAPASSTERAAYEGRLLAGNLSGKTRSLPNYKGFPRLTNTMPSVACFGPTEAYLRQHHIRCKKIVVELHETPAGKIFGTRLGFVKLLADHSGRLIGGTIVSDQATALANEISLAIRHRVPVIELASTPHPVNDFSYAIQMAAKRLVSPKD